jgi:hypothetical protein
VLVAVPTCLLLAWLAGPVPEPGPALDADPSVAETTQSVSPPRVDGFYLGGAFHTGAGFVRVEAFETAPFFGGGGNLNVGAAVLPWMTIGFEGRGAHYFNELGQTLFQGGLIAEAGFYPMPGRPLSIRTGLGFGLAFARDESQIPEKRRAGLGFPQFLGSVRYEFFPGAAKRRPYRAGGFTLGPEIGWRGWTPSKRGRPMANTVFIGLWIGWYRGR